MKNEVVIVGGGMAGLTAAAFLCKSGIKVALLEKEPKVGGLVNSFDRGGFVFDGGIRAIENSGIVRPMLKQLGIELEFLDSAVSIGFGRDVLKLSSSDSLKDYRDLLVRHFPGNASDIDGIISEIARIMGYMDVLYGIDNPLFLDLRNDPGYVFGTILPWLLKYLRTMPKVARLNIPVDEYLAKFTRNQSLIDMIAQHFFRKTPTFFALSYFSLYLDYRYPKGGTGSLSGSLERYVRERGGEILTGTEIVRVDPGARKAFDSKGEEHAWDRLIWAADTRQLYRILDIFSLSDPRVERKIAAKALEVADKKGGDSILTLYLSLDLDSEYFRTIASAHFFHTPVTTGLSELDLDQLRVTAPGKATAGYTTDGEALFAWVGRYLELTTYEISCPALRDPSLAPAGKTGLVVSTLMDYSLVRHIRDQGSYEALKVFCGRRIVEVLEKAIFPGLGAAVIDSFASTPLTIERTSGNSDGAITGWAFTNDGIPAVNRLPRVASSVKTPIPGVYQAGQWSFSPSGLPIAILTGKLAADRIAKDLRGRDRLGRPAATGVPRRVPSIRG